MPGQFQSDLDIRQDGRFTYKYTGEIKFAFPPHEEDVPWTDSMAHCLSDSHNEARPCTAAELNEKRNAYEREQERDQEAGRDLAMLIGYNPIDAQSNERLARELTRYAGWKKVTYKGSGTFYVEYEQSGILDRDFAFPILPQVPTAMPFVNIARNINGNLSISAAGLASIELRRLIHGQTPDNDRDDPYYLGSQSILDQTKGTFSVSTDVPIISTNGKQSQSGGVQRIEWSIDSDTTASPRLELGLGQ